MRISPARPAATGVPGVPRGRDLMRSTAATICLGIAAAGDAWWIASTRPFTGWSQVAVVAGGAVVSIVAADAYRHRAPRGMPVPGSRRLLAGLAGRAEQAGPAGRAGGGRASIVPWLVVAAAIVAFELVTLVAGVVASRHAFPTVSSLYDAAARARGAKAAVVLVWLGLGWSLFRR